MKDFELFQLALGLQSPWFISSSSFNAAQKRLDIRIDFESGSTFSCPVCGHEGMKVNDATEKTWRHLNFFQDEAYLTARVPRISCTYCGIVTLKSLPWTGKESGFSLVI